jgi:Tfp pilus assembly protein FimT
MKSKQTMLMFGLAMFAVMGMMATPAFASAIQSTHTYLTVSGQVTTDSATTYGCAGIGNVSFTQNLTVVNSDNDRVRVAWNGAGCPAVDTVKVEIFVDGTEVYDVTYNTASGSATKETPINSGDNVQAYVTFYD